MSFRKFVILYSFCIFSLALYSYTQVTSGFQLISGDFFTKFHKQMFFIGQKMRPLSALIFTLTVGLLFYFYFYLLKNFKENKFEKRLWRIIFLSSFILFFSYPAAFSHDIFTYVFEAKALVFYRQNPYKTIPLDFPNDPLLKMIHWPKMPFRYGPLWLILTSIFYLPSFNNITFSLFSFKFLSLLSYLGSTYFIVKLSRKYFKNISAMIFFTFNPLVLIDSLVSPHLDVTMLFFLVLSIYFFFQNKTFKSFIFWIFSAAIKFASLGFGLILFFRKRLKLGFEPTITITLILVYIITFVEVLTRSINSWYFIVPIGLVALVNNNFYLRTIVFANSIGALIRYVPFIYLGYFDPKNKIRLILFLIVHLIFFFYLFLKKSVKNQKSHLKIKFSSTILLL